MKLSVSKKVFFRVHSWIGIKLSILFFLVCFSGTLATLSHEMDWLFISDMRATPQTEFASRNLIVSNLKKIYPKGIITYWLRQEEPYLCDLIYVVVEKKRTYVFANPYTGKIQGHANLTFHRFFRDLHYFLYIPNQVGNFMVLAFGFLLFISLLTALFFYKKWWRKLFVLQTRKGALVFFRSLHRLVGLWSIPFTLLFSITGIWYFMERVNIADVGTTANPMQPRITAISSELDTTINLSYTIDYDKAITISEQEISNLKVQSISPPSSYKNPIYLRGKSNVALVRQRANRVFINPQNYEVLKIQDAKNSTTTMWLNDIADPIHFGYWGGLTTKIIWFIMGLGISSLILSGIWITLKRNAVSRKKNKIEVLGIWKYINWLIYGIMMYFMYSRLVTTYHASPLGITIISIGWLVLIGLAYYVFVYRLTKTVKK